MTEPAPTPAATLPVHVAGLRRDLPLCEVAPGVTIAVFNMLGDVEVVEAAAAALVDRLPERARVLVTAEAKSIPLAHAMARRAALPYVVLRKTWKPYMGEGLDAETLSITTGREQRLHLDAKDLAVLRGKAAVIVDDVVSTGSTIEAMHHILTRAGAEVVGEMAVFTEGDAARWRHVIALGHLPVFLDEDAG